jgi:hypothetical protein
VEETEMKDLEILGKENREIIEREQINREERVLM